MFLQSINGDQICLLLWCMNIGSSVRSSLLGKTQYFNQSKKCKNLRAPVQFVVQRLLVLEAHV